MDAEFTEKEYENPLYLELLAGSPHLWTPSQVFEEHFGIDAALEIHLARVWRLLGYATAPRGAILEDYSWGFVWRRLRGKRLLPGFEVNLLVQAKRTQIMKNRPAELRKQGLTSPYWRFSTKPHQQAALDAVSDRLGNRAAVVYAAGAFGQLSELFKYTESGDLVDNSTFVATRRLSGHEHWVYDQPGCSGFACTSPEPHEGEPIAAVIERLAGEAEPRGGPDADGTLRALEYTANQIFQALDTLPEVGPRTREFMRLVREQEPLDAPSLGERAARAFVQIQLFAVLHQLTWNVVG